MPELIEIFWKRLQMQKLLNYLGTQVTSIITSRTRLGLDVEGSEFQDYSKAYLKYRIREGKPVHPVQLTFDDYFGMIHKIEHKVFNSLDGVEISIYDKDKKRIASYHNDLGAGRNHVIRKFWGISDKEEEKLVKLANKKASDLLDTLV
jgi:hypothetical protein